MRCPWFVSAGALCAATLVLLLPACSKKRRAPDLRNLPVAAGDASLVGTSPYAGEEYVALSRETILRFDAPLDPASVHDGDVVVDAGGERVPVRLHLGRDGKALTLFWAQGRGPVGADVVVTINGDALTSAQSGRPIDADGDGFTGGLTQLTFRTLDLTRVAGTDVCGRVFASEVDGDRSVPLQGVTIRVDGLETEAFTTTDFLGSFCLRDLPAGVVFVHIDGSTATNRTPGFYYPNVGKAWQTVAGQRVNAGTVHLPAVAQSTLQPVAQDRAVEVRMVDEQLGRVLDPALRARLANVALTVPADSLFADNGTRGGRVGIAPVAPDRLPGTLPPGLDLRLVITVQTDGASNFDAPAPICMPNMAHPKTGERLPAGAKSALWSFNHDTGRFEVVGAMTVSEDGEMVCTDPGVGIRAPGWHGSAPGSDGDGGPGNNGPDGPCKPTVWDLIKAGWRFAKRLAACIKDVSGLSQKVNCLYRAVLFAEATIVQLATLANELEGEITAADAVRIAQDLARKKAAALEVMQECERGASPVFLAKQVTSCFLALTTALTDLCNAIRECTTILGQGRICAILNEATEWLARADQLAGVVDRILKKKMEQAVCRGLEAALRYLEDYLRSEAPPENMTPQQRAELRAMLLGIIEQAPLMREADEAAGLIAGLAEPVRRIPNEAARAMSNLVGAIGTPLRQRQQYVLAFDNVGPLATRRGTSTATGTLQALVPADEPYFHARFDPVSRMYGESFGITSSNGQATRFNTVTLNPISGLPDADSDGLPDDVEFVLDTDPALADSDDDGMNDGDEVFAGRDPLDGIGGRAGVRSATDTAGGAIDIAAADGLVAVALGDSGVDMFNVYNGMAPERVARIDTPGSALRVACARAHVAVADGAEGLTILDVSVPEDTRIAHRLPLGDVRAVTVSGGVVWAGTASGQVSLVEITQGVRLGGANVAGAIVDVQVRGDVGYALTDAAVHVLRRRGLVLEVAATVQLGRSGCVRLFAGDDTLVATHWRGFVALDLATDPLAPRILAATDTGQRGWRQLVLDGSGYGLGVVGLNTTPDGNDDVHVYDLRDPRVRGTFLRDFNNDGLGTAIPSAVVSYDGLAYLADRRGKLIVLRYLRRDLGRTRPELTFATSLPEPRVEEGKVLALRARVRDDVQAQYVDFYVGDERVATDASYPFEHTFTAPARTQTAQLSVWARAWDTGGNDTVSEQLAIEVQADSTAPEVIGRIPGPAGVVAADVDQTIAVTFSEPLSVASVQATSLTIVHAGADQALGTADDVALPVASVTHRPELQLAVWRLAAAFPSGRLRATLHGTLTDAAGNPVVATSWDFEAVDGLAVRFFAEVDRATLETFFASKTAREFDLYRPGVPGQRVTSAVVPHVAFAWVSTPWLGYMGIDGTWQTSSLTQPLGDDMTMRGLTGNAFGVLLEATMQVPANGDVVFSALIDNALVFEIDGRTVLSVYGASGGRYSSGPVTLTAGPHRVRLAFADWGSVARLTLEATGGGFGGGIISPSAFRR